MAIYYRLVASSVAPSQRSKPMQQITRWFEYALTHATCSKSSSRKEMGFLLQEESTSGKENFGQVYTIASVEQLFL